MEKYSGFVAWTLFYAMMAGVAYTIIHSVFINWKIKQDPVSTFAQIVSYYPKKPNDSGKVDLIMTYTFRANDMVFTKKNQTLTISTIDLGKYHVGKEIPVIYNRNDPKYSSIDRYNKILKN